MNGINPINTLSGLHPLNGLNQFYYSEDKCHVQKKVGLSQYYVYPQHSFFGVNFEGNVTNSFGLQFNVIAFVITIMIFLFIAYKKS